MSSKQCAVFETSVCQFCHGQDIPKGACRKYGLKFRNSICIPGDVRVKYHEVKVRNSTPWWKVWKRRYDIEMHVIHTKPYTQIIQDRHLGVEKVFN